MGLEAAGMTTVFQCEIDKHARSVLDYHWPDVPKWDDVSTLTGAHILETTGGVDLVAWGSPCQDLSLAGKRAGLSGDRSGLFHEGIRIIKELRELSNGKYPSWSIWENVVGALSSNRGADFGEVLYEMDEAGACFSEWTVLDAQYFGVPQRRRRVFVSSCFDSSVSERCGSPLFPVSESLRGDSSQGIETGKAVTRKTQDRIGTGGELASGKDVANTISASLYHKSTVVNQDVNNGHLVIEPVLMRQREGKPGGGKGPLLSDSSLTLARANDQTLFQPVTFSKSRRAQSSTDVETWVESDVTPTLNVFDVGDTRATTAIIEPVLAFDTQFGSNANVFEDQSPTLKSSQQSPSVTQSVAYSIREDAKAGNFSATEIETARALQALQPSVQSHHAQTFITQETDVVGPLAARDYKGVGNQYVAENKLVTQESPMLIDGRRVDDVRVYTEPVQTLQERMGTGGNNVPVVAQETQAISYDGYNQTIEEEIHRPWRIGKDSGDFIADLRPATLVVRRLTPLECERLMGWPDNHTAIGTNGPISDTQRFKMCGNGVASPVATWIAGHLPAPTLNG